MATPSPAVTRTLTELDFDTIKGSLVNYLRSRPLFKDYDFQGSDLSLLTDLLALNSYRNAFYTNMVMAEGFLDSAQTRASVYSHAKELNYVPRSPRSSRARVRVTFQASGVNQPYVVQKGQTLNTLVKNKAYTFSVPETIVVSSPNSSFSLETDVYEGVYVRDAYVYQPDSLDPYPRLKLTNQSADASSLVVQVYEDGSSVADVYKLARNTYGLDGSSRVFFLQASESGFFEVVFGDGVLGRAPKTGARVVLDYRVTVGPEADGASLFVLNFDPTGPVTELTSAVSVVTVEPARGGAAAESVESIRYYAPRYFQTQERATTALDYEVLLKTNFPEISAVNVYGGEEDEPPQFGKVVIAVDVAGVAGVPDSKKREYANFLKGRNSLAIQPVFRDPLYTFLRVDSLVRYNVNVSATSVDRVRTLVKDAVTRFNARYLDSFKVVLRYSALVEAIDGADDSIVSNVTAVTMYKKEVPKTGQPVTLVSDFGVALERSPMVVKSRSSGLTPDEESSSVFTSAFVLGGERCLIRDDGAGKLVAVRVSDVTDVVAPAGTVDYATGRVSLAGIVVDDFDGDYLLVYAHPADLDVAAARRNILRIEPGAVRVAVEPLRV